MNLRMLSEEGIELLDLVRREVVGDDVSLFAAWLVGHDVGEERHELG
jgi:hypothetical protein